MSRHLIITLLIFFLNSSFKAISIELPVARQFHRMVAIDNKIVVLGGAKGIDIFDTKTQTWSHRQTPEPFGVTLLASIQNKLYLYYPNKEKKGFRRYDFADNKWTLLPPPKIERGNAALIAFRGKVYLIGGYTDQLTRKEDSVEVFDPQSNSWEFAPPLPDFEKTDHFHLTAVLDDHLHVAGHFFGGKSHWVFDGKEWQAKADVPFDCGWKSTNMETVGGKLYLFQVIHGKGQGKPSPDNIISYDPQTDQWSNVGEVPKEYPLMLSASAVVGSKVYISGGYSQSSDSRGVLVYDVKTGEWLK